MTDTHCHLNLEALEADLDGVLQRAGEEGVGRFLVPGTNLADSERAATLAANHPNVWAALGVHPCEAAGQAGQAASQLEQLFTVTPKAVAVGEVGLDYYHFSPDLDGQGIERTKTEQQRLFQEMIQLAQRRELPLVIHSREAFADTYAMLRQAGAGRAVIHCFVGSWQEAEQWLDLGCLLSFTNIITYRKNEELRQVVRRLPLDRLLLETDAPFLPPEGQRGQRCEPMHVRQVAECVAQVKGISLQEVEAVTDRTASQFFSLTA